MVVYGLILADEARWYMRHDSVRGMLLYDASGFMRYGGVRGAVAYEA